VTGHQGHGAVAAVDPLGRITEQAAVETDGSFTFLKTHAVPEYVVYTSARSLAVVPLEMDPEVNEIVVHLPAAPLRTFSVRAPTLKRSAAFIGLWIGNRYVPLQMLAIHQESRGHDLEIQKGSVLTIFDVLESAPISIALGDEPEGDFVDVFTLPQYAGVQRQTVTSASIELRP
jgi:hypothetical protein